MATETMSGYICCRQGVAYVVFAGNIITGIISKMMPALPGNLSDPLNRIK